jgi:phage shock protein PspC (stress-responsive transcriptional regulator)
MNLHKRLYRSRDDRMVAGVAGGMAEYLGIDPTIVRILWVLAFLPGGVPGFLLYGLCWLIIPNERSAATSWD